jgi:CAAX prenyl protease-like protein
VAALVTRIWSEGGLDRWYGVRVVAGAGVLLALSPTLPRPSLSWSWTALVVGVAVGAAWVAFGDADLQPALERATLGSHPGFAWIAIRLVGSCLLVPVIEELAFRGFLLRWLASTDFEHAPPRAWTWPAVLLSSLAFGAMHSRWILGTAAGVGFAAVYLRRGRLADAVLAHAIANAVVAAAVLLGGRWDLWA